MKTYFDMYFALPSLFFVCCLLPHLTGGASQLCSAGASHGDGCALSAHCVGSGVFLEWETMGYPQVDVLNLEYQKNNGEHHAIVSYYPRRQGSHTFLAPEGGQVTWTFSGCYHNDFWTEFSVASLTLTCGDADIGLEFVKVEEEVKSRKKSGGVSGRERRVADDIMTGTDSRMEYKGLSNIATFFLGAVLGGGVAVVVIGAFVVAKDHTQKAPALNI